jgi:hypothetical protein
MLEPFLFPRVFEAWRTVVHHIAAADSAEVSGSSKETRVLLRPLRTEIERLVPSVRINGPDPDQERFNNWRVDLVCRNGPETIALEGKFKTLRDGAPADNRKEAFFDLYKLETYVDSGKYSMGIFLWLTDNPAYLRSATKDSREFSTHDGRIYEPDVPLNANRPERNASRMPLPLILTRRYVFRWETVTGTSWHHLALVVPKKG